MRYFWLAVLMLVGGSGCDAGSAQHALPSAQQAYDVLYYDLDVEVNPEQQRVRGHVTVEAVVTDSLQALVLDLDHRLTAEQAWGIREDETDIRRSVERSADDDRIRVRFPAPRPPGDTVRVRVAYHGAPRVAPNPPWDGGVTWDTTSTGAPWIGTSVQTAGASLWWPAKEHPSDAPDSMDISITVPDSLTGASNGRLREVERASDSTRTFRWHVSVPINTYNVTMNVAPYARVDTTYQSTADDAVPVSFYALPSDSARAARVLPDFLDQLRFLEETLGPYPPRADKYGVAQAPFLGMEHQSLIAYGHSFTDGGLGYDAPFDALHFHELAHEWYGNAVTVADWKDFWIHEGPATYLEALYAEHLEGDSAYHAVIDHFRDQVVGGVPIAKKDPAAASDIYHRDVYFRGAMVLHTLRYLIGEKKLRAVLRQFVHPPTEASGQRSPFRHVGTRDFIATAEAVAGRSLDSFFEVYLYRDERPRLTHRQSEGTLTLRWDNTGDVTFDVPVPVRVNGAMRRVEMREGTGSIDIPSDADVEIDPQGWLLRQ
ncbi:MAG: M1 family metallopeptidase [Salinibacter sp.]